MKKYDPYEQHEKLRSVRLFILLICCACGSGEASLERAESVAATDSFAAKVMSADSIAPGYYAVQPLADLTELENEQITRARGDDRGVVYSPAGSWSGNHPPDLIIRSDSSVTAPMVSYVKYESMSDGGWRSVHAANQPQLFADLERAGHEEYGLPGERLSERWARVIYAYTRTGQEQTGWVQLKPDTLVFTAYDEQLFDFDVHFAHPDSVEFFDRPQGNRVPFSLTTTDSVTGENPDYTLRVLELRDDWIRVAVSVPDTAACGGDENAKVTRRADVWVMRVNRRGQRQLWAAVAGC
jgi:hypothetical protein